MNFFDEYKNILAMFCSITIIIGSITIITCVFAILLGIFYAVKNFIKVQIHKYKIKHRFDKSPTAKCYCIDCKNCQVEEYRGRWCYRFERCVADNWFCWEAEPNIPCEYIKKGES